MQMVGINSHIDPKIAAFYDRFYDILRTPDSDEQSRLLKPMHGIQTVGSLKNRRCRFCGRSEKEVPFKKIAHVFPEAIGNSTLASNYECDICNQFFGNTIENEYANFFSLYHSIMRISGKNGIPKASFKVPCEKRSDKCANHCVEIYLQGNLTCIRKCEYVGSQYVRTSNNEIIISKPVGNCCPIAVFKTFVKMAIAVMPQEELPLFEKSIEWLRETKHQNFYSGKELLVRYKMIPGFDVTKYPHYCLFRRKRSEWLKPYMLFNITYGCFSLLIEIPRDCDKSDNDEFLSVPFPPIPFYTSTEGTWDMTENCVPKGMMHSIVLNADNSYNCTEDIK